MKIPTLETEKVHVTFLDNKIFKVHVKENVVLDLADLDNNYFFFKEHLSTEKVHFLFVFDKGANLVNGLSEKFKDNALSKLTLKEAFVIVKFSTRLKARIQFFRAKSQHPIKVFSSEKEALRWLEV